MTIPHEYCQQKAAQSGSSFYYSFLFLPPDAAPRDHRALRVLPRSRRRRRRDAATPASRAPSSRGGARRSPASITAQPQHPVARALAEVVAPLSASTRRSCSEVIDGMAMDLDYNALPRLRGAEGLLPPRRRRRRHALRAKSSATRIRARSSTRTISGSRSSSPTSSATSARTRGATASTCRCTSSRDYGVTTDDIAQARETDNFRKLMEFQIERAQRLLRRGVREAAGRGPQGAARRDSSWRRSIARCSRRSARRLPRAHAAHGADAGAQAVDRVEDVDEGLSNAEDAE